VTFFHIYFDGKFDMEYNCLYSLIKFLIENCLFSDMIVPAGPIFSKAFNN